MTEKCRHTKALAEVSFSCKGKLRQQRPKNLFCSKQTLIIASHLQVAHFAIALMRYVFRYFGSAFTSFTFALTKSARFSIFLIAY